MAKDREHDVASSQGCCSQQEPDKARNTFFLRAFGRSVNLLMPCFWTISVDFGLLTYEPG